MQLSEAEKKAGSVAELAKILDCSRHTVYKWANKYGYKDVPQPWLDALKQRRPEWFKKGVE
jgi:DNA invertase Pin-like site-specific DNA recombinase